MLRTRLSAGVMLVCAAVLATAGIALAAHQVKGASYTGTYGGEGSTTRISFKVAANGKRITALAVETPIVCGGGCGGFSSPSGATAKISSKGTFDVKLPIKGVGPTAKVIGTDTVTGTFLAHGRAKGTAASHFNSGSSSDRKVTWTASSS